MKTQYKSNSLQKQKANPRKKTTKRCSTNGTLERIPGISAGMCVCVCVCVWRRSVQQTCCRLLFIFLLANRRQWTPCVRTRVCVVSVCVCVCVCVCGRAMQSRAGDGPAAFFWIPPIRSVFFFFRLDQVWSQNGGVPVFKKIIWPTIYDFLPAFCFFFVPL